MATLHFRGLTGQIYIFILFKCCKVSRTVSVYRCEICPLHRLKGIVVGRPSPSLNRICVHNSVCENNDRVVHQSLPRRTAYPHIYVRTNKQANIKIRTCLSTYRKTIIQNELHTYTHRQREVSTKPRCKPFGLTKLKCEHDFIW